MIWYLVLASQFSRSSLVSSVNHPPSPGCSYRCNSEYVISENRHNIIEDFGPEFSMVITPLAFFFFAAWPVVIGTVSLFYCGKCSGFSPPLTPCLTTYSHKHIHILQARTSAQAANVVYHWSQSWPIHSPDGHFRRGDTRDHSVGHLIHRARFEAWCYTLERLGLHAPALF